MAPSWGLSTLNLGVVSLILSLVPGCLLENSAEYYGCGINKDNNDLLIAHGGSRIVGGQNTTPGEWPWQVSVMLTHPQYGHLGHWCGGALIDRYWILTAAHCIINPLFALPQHVFWQVLVGENDFRHEEGSEKILPVERVLTYPWYREYNNDIALMKLAKPAKFTKYVRPICLPDINDEFVGMECYATGWGRIGLNKRPSPYLQKVRVNITDNDMCNSTYSPTFGIQIGRWHICAIGKAEGGEGTCHGDSGGPLQCIMKDNKFYLVGITSFGSACAKPGYPDGYSRITYFLNWINQYRLLYGR